MGIKYLSSAITLVLIICAACANKKTLFVKLDPVKTGIDFVNTLTPNDVFNIIDYPYFYNGGGVAVGDINGDNLPDIFFSGNQVKNRLYLNKGDFKFEDISISAGITGNSSWNTGSIMGDVNGDGLLDIYVCAVVGIRNQQGHNELFINNGDNTFSERSAEYGLDYQTYCSSATFLDFDLDGDLDIFLLNHAIHTVESFGHADLRNKRTYETGGKLLRNEGNKFTDVSVEANIYGGINGYGLGVAISDFNLDGYPDIYVGNDFHEDDYLYINNRNGSFTEQGKVSFTMTSKFSMGNDVADINHDGLPDLITLDMLPEDENVLKRSVDEENINIMRLRTEKYGYAYQFPRNMLQINLGNGHFAELGLMSGVAATDWSWSAIFADYDQDGNQDIFISNGIPKRPNDLDYIKYVSSEQVVNIIGKTTLADDTALALMPSGLASNYVFKGNGEYSFVNVSQEWLPNELTSSTATAIGDLDNDGDLDIVINNVDAPPIVMMNTIKSQTNNYIKIKLSSNKPNSYSIGAKVYTYHNGIMQFKEMYCVRGFQSSSEPLLHFGFGNTNTIDSIKVIWPGGHIQKLTNIKTNQTLRLNNQDSTRVIDQNSFVSNNNRMPFGRVNPVDYGIDFVHTEDRYTDFDRLKLLPYSQADRGPATAVGDLNGDGLNDIYFGGSKHIPGQVYLLEQGKFVRTYWQDILKDSVKEDIDAIIADFSNDNRNDIFVGTGGADFYGKSPALTNSYYKKEGSDQFHLELIPLNYDNTSCVRPMDFDNDGDIDLFVGNRSVSNDFGKIPTSYLLLNENGNFKVLDSDPFGELGMITDAIWCDYNLDGYSDLIVIGEWMSPVFLKNLGGVFQRDDLRVGKLNGLWQSIMPFDFDGDGDTDFILGNWGLNSKFYATADEPLKMYYHDFDDNGIKETVLAMYKNGKYYPIEGLDMLTGQLPILRKKFTSYASFAGKSFEEVFSSLSLEDAFILEVHQLGSGVLLNNGDKFEFRLLQDDFQIAPITTQIKFDFDSDSIDEIVLGGNYFGVQPFHGRFGSFTGALLEVGGKYLKGEHIGLNFHNKSVRHLNIVSINGENYLLVTINNDKPQLYKINR
jgi:enediyne biosynthesis protein E4